MIKKTCILLVLVVTCVQVHAKEETFNGKLIIKKYPRYQQAKEYTCGPASLLALANYYRGEAEFPLTSDMEQLIENEAGTVPWTAPDKPAGTNPEQMKAWLIAKGFNARLEFISHGDANDLSILKERVARGIPCIVAWADWGGHWATVIGYDDRNTDDITDDILTFADPYDRVDGKVDSRTEFSAFRFYWMWFESLCFNPLGPPTWGTLITVE